MLRGVLVGLVGLLQAPAGLVSPPHERGSAEIRKAVTVSDETGSDEHLGSASPNGAIEKYGQSLPSRERENYRKLRHVLFRKPFTDLYIIKFYSESTLCQSIDGFGNPPALVKTVADSIIQGRKDEEDQKTARANIKNSTIASVSAMISAVLSFATLVMTLRRKA